MVLFVFAFFPCLFICLLVCFVSLLACLFDCFFFVLGGCLFVCWFACLSLFLGAKFSRVRPAGRAPRGLAAARGEGGGSVSGFPRLVGWREKPALGSFQPAKLIPVLVQSPRSKIDRKIQSKLAEDTMFAQQPQESPMHQIPPLPASTKRNMRHDIRHPLFHVHVKSRYGSWLEYCGSIPVA